MKRLRLFNAYGSLTVHPDRITGHLIAIQEDGQAIEVIQETKAIEGGIIGVKTGEQRAMLISALFSADARPKVGTLTLDKPALNSGEPHIQAAIRDLLRAMEDRLA